MSGIMDFNNYVNKVNFPIKPTKPVLKGKTPNDYRVYADELEKYEADLEQWKEDLKKHGAEERKLQEQFKEDMFKFLGIENHPKRERVFTEAWNEGHSAGYYEVFIIAEDLVHKWLN